MAYASLEDAAVNGWEVERQYLCQAHGDSSPSASLNMNGFYCCYACGDRGKLDMSKIEVTPVAVKKLVERVNDKLADNRKIYSESWLDIFDGDGPGDYWLSRFTKEACEFYRLGRTSERATYPMRGDNGEVLGVVYRNHDNPKRKYEYPMNVRVSNHLFDIHRVESQDLVLVEGATDAIACWDVGAHVAVASYRAGISDEQARKIRKYDPRILWVAYDMDKAGKAGFRQVKEALPDVNVRRMTWFDFKDLASIPLRLRAELLSTVLI